MIEFSPTEVLSYYAARLPDLPLHGKEARGPCPIHGGKDKNFAVNLETGQAICHSQCGRGWDILSFEQELTGVDFQRAKEEVFQIIGRANGGSNGHSSHAGTGTRVIQKQGVPKPAGAVRSALERDGWVYHSEANFGDNLRQVRFEHSTKIQAGKGRPQKAFLWEHRIENEWFSGAGGRPLPIYFNATASRGGKINSILLVEGWGKADAADTLGLAAASLKEIGAANVDGLSDVDHIVIWPDNDAHGRNLAARVAELLTKRSAEVYMIEPPTELPEGGDIQDAMNLGWDRKKIHGLIAGAKRITPERPFGVADVRSVLEYSGGAEIHYVVDKFIAEGTLTVLSGESGCGKTTVVAAIAEAVARGVAFCGMATSRRPVVYLDRENPLPVVAERNCRLGVVDGHGFTIWGGWCEAEPPGPMWPDLLAWAEACNPKPLMIFDSLISFFDGRSENDSAEMRRYMQGFRKLADIGCTVLVVHHSGKGESTKDFRGSSDIKASIDTGWYLSNLGEGRLDRLRLRAWKCRFAVAPDLVLTYTDGQFIGEDSSPSRSITESLIDMLKANPGIRGTEFEVRARDKGLGRDRARKFLHEGVKTGSVDRRRGRHNSTFFTWLGTDEKE
jgi:hypothetical protein